MISVAPLFNNVEYLPTVLLHVLNQVGYWTFKYSYVLSISMVIIFPPRYFPYYIKASNILLELLFCL